VSFVRSSPRPHLLRPVLPAGVIAALLLSLLTLVSPAPTSATSTYLCTGYRPCARAGYSHAGYARANNQMYWRMYAGHNCTNYVAYRMIKNGMSASRPWSGSGMAYNWGVANSRITDQTPRVGAVAWWKRNTGGVGSSGHVAYVEKVISNRRIIVSEDSWGGDFDWRKIVKSGSGWPSGFIHFNDKDLVSTSLPTVVGTPKVGARLRATVGGWQGGPTSYAFQWLANGVAIPGATAATYVPTAPQAGVTIAVRVTAKRSGFQSGTATSAASAPVAEGTFAVVPPTTVSGTPVVGQVLRAAPGAFVPAPEELAVQWRVDGEILSRSRTLTIDESLVGKTITAVAVARRTGYVRATSPSAPVGPVLVGAVEMTEPYDVSGRPRVGETVSITPGAFTPPDATVSYAWLRDGVAIPGATATSYVLQPGDAGRQVAARVSLTKPRYLPRVEVLPVGAMVRSVPTIKLRTAGKSRRAVVTVKVRGLGDNQPSGALKVKVGNRRVKTQLKQGRAQVVVRKLTPGRRRVTAIFGGSRVIEQGRKTAVVWVKR
jgi:surface antigen